MKQRGYEVMIVQSGEFALNLIYQTKPYLMLLDIVLSGIDGWENVRLNPDYRNIKMVFLAAM